MLWHVYPTRIDSYRDSFFLLLKYTFSALKHHDNCGNFSYYRATCHLSESDWAQIVQMNAEAQRSLPMAAHLTAGRMKGLAAGLELREVTKKKGKLKQPRHPSGHLLVLVTKYCEITECPFSCFDSVPLHWVPPGPAKLRGRSKSHLLAGKGALRRWLGTVPPFGYCNYQEVWASFTTAHALVQTPLQATVRKEKGDFTKSSGYVLNVLCCHHQLCWFLVILGICFPPQPDTGERSCVLQR